ncbi:O-antigen ligase family protein [Caballeronia sp. dw_19]|uniref:O-antigen ligase family protein n=1 Tax=Caballeronia sp. dw_19 TaxID=2719791 RepID=UPI002103F5F6|nr:O-antigen ligase family protein [Caballeronia sp. dw_19]
MSDFGAYKTWAGSPGMGDGTVYFTRPLVWGLLVAGFALSPLGDFLSVFALKGGVGGDFGARYSLFLRGIVLVGLLAMMSFRGRVQLSSLRIMLLVVVAVGASSISYALAGMTSGEYVEEVIAILKVFSFFVYVAALSGLSDRQLAKLEPVVRAALIIYALSIVAGATFSIDMFRSYRGDTQIRAGYKGIIYAQNETSALMMIGLSYAYLRILHRGWTFLDAIFVGLLLVASMLVGTKGAMVGALGVICAYFYARYGILKATLRAASVAMLLIGTAIVVYVSVPAVQQAVDLSLNYFAYQRDRTTDDQLLTIVMSGRNVKLANVWSELSRQDYVALLTGGYPTVRYPIEIDGPDLVLALGFPVFSLYLFDLGRTFIHRRGGSVVRFGKLFFVVLMVIACTAGHVLVSAIVGPFLAVIAVLVNRAAISSNSPSSKRGFHND